VDICDFLKTAQGNREMTAVIKKLQEAVEKAKAEAKAEAEGEDDAEAEGEAEEAGEQKGGLGGFWGSCWCGVAAEADAGAEELGLPWAGRGIWKEAEEGVVQ